MPGMTKRIARTVCVVLAIAGAGVLGLPASAPAAPSGAPRATDAVRPDYSGPTAFLERDQWLTGSPKSGMPQACISKSIYLKADTYTFTVYLGQYANAGANYPDIPAGTYYWQACITPESGTPPSPGRYNVDALVESSSFSTSWSFDSPVSGSGYYLWGSTLSPW